jgi:hypothetical protein
MPSPEFSEDPSLPSSEDLDAVVAEQQIAAETTVNNVNEEIHIAKCFRCDETEHLSLCRHCGHEFCNNHRSKYSDQYCYLCIAPDNLGLEYLPLEDEDIDPDTGKIVVHHGRRIKLIGEGWPSNMQMVNSLDDAGLEIFIAERQRLLKEAVATAEYHRITLSHAEFTKEYKRHSKAAKLQRRYTEIQQGAVRLSGKTHRVVGVKKQDSEDEKLMKLLGLTAEQLRLFKKAMNKI